MSRDAGAVGAAVGVDRERPLGGGARVEHRVHVADEEDPRAAGGRDRRAACPTIVDAERGPPGRAGPRPRRRCRQEARRRTAPTSSTPAGV